MMTTTTTTTDTISPSDTPAPVHGGGEGASVFATQVVLTRVVASDRPPRGLRE
jgi:hypothetical protein